jgi:HSP20 family molecular chaperone IbpA
MALTGGTINYSTNCGTWNSTPRTTVQYNGPGTWDSGTLNTGWYTVPGSTTTITTAPEPKNKRNMKENKLDDKYQFIIELAGFRREEITVKYLPSNEDNCDQEPYIDIVAKSTDHLLKEIDEDIYEFTHTEHLSTDREYSYEDISVKFRDGLLIIEVPFKENSRIKTLEIGS